MMKVSYGSAPHLGATQPLSPLHAKFERALQTKEEQRRHAVRLAASLSYTAPLVGWSSRTPVPRGEKAPAWRPQTVSST